mgnify:CR=1 FL=1
MLGSTSSTHKPPRKIRGPEQNPRKVSGLVAWYDFSDTTTLWVERDSFTTQVASNGDSIGRIQNKATGGARMGEFLRATNNAERPTYQSGWGRFDGSNDSLWGYGTSESVGKTQGTASGKFSDVQLNPNDLTIFAVVNADSSSIGADGYILAISGTATNDNAEDVTIVLRHESSTNDIVYGAAYESETDVEINSGTNLAASATLIRVETSGSFGGTARIFLNDDTLPDVAGDITNDQSRVLEQTQHNLHGFCIGELITSAIGQVGTGLFDGDIGEILIYNRVLKSLEVSNIKKGLGNKWSLW